MKKVTSFRLQVARNSHCAASRDLVIDYRLQGIMVAMVTRLV